MYIFTYTCSIIQSSARPSHDDHNDLILITRRKYPDSIFPTKRVYSIVAVSSGFIWFLPLNQNPWQVCFSRNKHKPNQSCSLRNDTNPMLIYQSSPVVTTMQFLLYSCVASPRVKQDCKAIDKIPAQPGDTMEMLLIVRIKQELYSWFIVLYVLKI